MKTVFDMRNESSGGGGGAFARCEIFKLANFEIFKMNKYTCIRSRRHPLNQWRGSPFYELIVKSMFKRTSLMTRSRSTEVKFQWMISCQWSGVFGFCVAVKKKLVDSEDETKITISFHERVSRLCWFNGSDSVKTHWRLTKQVGVDFIVNTINSLGTSDKGYQHYCC